MRYSMALKVGKITGYLNNAVVHHKYHMSASVNISSINNGKIFKYGATGLNQVDFGFI